MPEFGDEKGILHPQEQARHRTLNRLHAGLAVGRFVEWYWAVRWDLRDQPAYADIVSGIDAALLRPTDYSGI